MLELQLKIKGDLESRVRSFMAENNVTASTAVRHMLGDASVKDTLADLENTPSVSLSVLDDIPPEFGRRGYVTTAVRYLAGNLEPGQSVVVDSLTDATGKRIPQSRVAMSIHNLFGRGFFQVLSKGLPDGKFIIRRKT